MAGTGAMLPPEVLYMVARAFINDLDDKQPGPVAFETLLALRRTSKFFAGMSVMKQALFKSITFYAVDANVADAENTDFSNIAPFVKQVSFVPSPHRVDLRLKDVEDVLVAGVIHHASDSGVKIKMTHFGYQCWTPVQASGSSLTDSKDNDILGGPPLCQECSSSKANWYIKFLQSAGNQQVWSLFSGVARQIHTQILKDAHRDQALISSGRVQRAWKTALKQLHSVKDVRLASFLSRTPSSRLNINKLFIHDCGPDCIQERKIINLTARCDASLFGAIVTCLATANIRPEYLSIDDEFLEHLVQYQGTPAWTHLDLSSVKSFRSVAARNEFCFPVEWDTLKQVCYDALLEKARNSIKHLSFDIGRASNFSSVLVPSLSGEFCPRLSTIELRSDFVDEAMLAADIRRLPALRRLVVDRSFSEGGGNWKAVFDAIRDHDRRPHVQFRGMVDYHCELVDIDCHPGANIKVRDEWDVTARLCRYLYHAGEWDDLLKLTFEE
ncbi:hypothetical protein H2200_004580 [Cladophialophora chaetospira]|uniref:Uncharacterized protein n=1 Tax=Cladophialophora chaetospira TaxID=386627 RepID=A0AA38XDD2_9EURO|nr:hypothetical protein H2200_004580 [Cladophialophora chaetospira]